MKKTLIAAALVATTAQADIRIVGDNTMLIDSRDWTNTALAVHINEKNGCKPRLRYFINNTGATPGEEFNGVAGWRVDYRPVRVYAFKAITDDKGQIADFGNMTGKEGTKALEDMRRGNVLRLKTGNADTGDAQYDSFSLAGFSAAYGKLKAQCKTAASYFEEHKPAASNDHELFL